MTTLKDRPHTALLVIDVQNDVVTGAHDRDAVVARIAELVARARERATPVVWVQHSDEDLPRGSDGWQYVPELVREPSEPLVHKSYGDSFEETDLEAVLAERGVGQLVTRGPRPMPASAPRCTAPSSAATTRHWSATPTPPRTRAPGALLRPSRSSRTPTSTGPTRPPRGVVAGPSPLLTSTSPPAERRKHRGTRARPPCLTRPDQTRASVDRR